MVSGWKRAAKVPESWMKSKPRMLEVDMTISLTFIIATLSGPKNWIPASSDIFTIDTNRSDPLMIKHERSE